MDGAPGLEAALAARWGEEPPIQRRAVPKHGNLLAHAPRHLQEELTEDYRDMICADTIHADTIYADTAVEIEERHKAFPAEMTPEEQSRRRQPGG